jgi:hypothetical protein
MTHTRLGRYPFAALLFALAAEPAGAAFVSAHTTTTNMGQLFAGLHDRFAVEHLSDGSCLGSLSLDATCARDDSAGSSNFAWLSARPPSGFVDFVFDRPLSFVGASIWNLNTDAGSNDDLNVQSVAWSWALDGSAYSPLSFAVNGAAQSTSGALTQIPSGGLAAASPDRLTFVPIVADALRLTLWSNFGGSYAGLSEVAFDASEPSATPAPATLLLVLPLLFWLGLRARLRALAVNGAVLSPRP